MMTLRWGGTLFPYYDFGGGGCGKFPTKMTSSIGGANYLCPEKGKEMKICCWTVL